MAELVETKFANLEDKVSKGAEEKAKKLESRLKNEANIKFRYKGNGEQFSFNSDVKNDILDVIEKIEKSEPSIEDVQDYLKDIVKNIDYRNKLIRMADKSEAGWSVVAEYEKDDVADNSEDEKRIKQAERRAIWKTKTRKLKRRAPATVSSEDQAKKARAEGKQDRLFRPKRVAGPNDICFRCSKPGHWSFECRSFKNQSFDSQKTEKGD